MIYYNRLIKERYQIPDGTFAAPVYVDITNITFVPLVSSRFYNLISSSSHPTFNQPVGGWNITRLKNLSYLLYHVPKFNQPIGDWDTSNVENMGDIFREAKSFNQPIGDWDVAKVINSFEMFKDAQSFNQDLSSWKLPESTDSAGMFANCPIKEKFKPRGV